MLTLTNFRVLTLIKNVAGTVTFRGFEKNCCAISGVDGIGVGYCLMPLLSRLNAYVWRLFNCANCFNLGANFESQ